MNDRKKKDTDITGKIMPMSQTLLDYLSFMEIKELLLRFSDLRSSSELNSIAILSELPKEGKSFFCAVLAAAVSQLDSNRRCLVVDAASHYPERSTVLDDTVEPLDNVDVVTLGDNENKLTEIINRSKGQYDFILIDTCSLQHHNRRNLDPILLARQASGAILVSSKGGAKTQNIKEERQKLANAGVRLLGIVHNENPLPEQQMKDQQKEKPRGATR